MNIVLMQNVYLYPMEDWSGGVYCTLTSASLVCPSGRSHRDHRSLAENNLVYCGRLFYLDSA